MQFLGCFVVRICAESNRLFGGNCGQSLDIFSHSGAKQDGLDLLIAIPHDFFDFSLKT